MGENYSIICDFPLFNRLEQLAKGKGPWVHDLTVPARFGVLPRLAKSGGEIRWFETSPCFAYHIGNAWEANGSISIVGARSPFMDQGLGSSVWHMHRWDVDLSTGLVKERELSSIQCEFPIVDGQLTGRYSRYMYAARFEDQQEKMTPPTANFNGVVRLDLETDTVQENIFEDGLLGGEVVFARHGGNNREGDGVLMTF